MAEMALDCPHCETEKIGHKGVGESRVGVRLGPRGIEYHIWNTFFECRNCNNVTVVILSSSDRDRKPMDSPGDPKEDRFSVEVTYPKPLTVESPKHTPEHISRNFIEAVDNLKRKNYTSAAMMFRKVLDRSTLEIDKNLSGDRLDDRIKSLSQAQKITPAMKQWADIIKVEGNIATHDQDADEDTAKQLHSFTEMFLRYVFTLDTEVKNHLTAQQKSSKKSKPVKAKTAT